jgi:hypothetical protein
MTGHIKYDMKARFSSALVDIRIPVAGPHIPADFPIQAQVQIAGARTAEVPCLDEEAHTHFLGGLPIDKYRKPKRVSMTLESGERSICIIS